MAVDSPVDPDLKGRAARGDDMLPEEATRAVRLTGWAMWWEALARALWPAFVWAAMGLAALALGAGDALPEGWLGAAVIVWAVVLILALAVPLWRMQRPRMAAVVARVDATLPGRPLSALNDALAVGAGNPGALALWGAHLRQMWTAAARARPARPAAGLARRDPLALRLAALTALAMALLFGVANPLGQGVGAVASTFRGPPPVVPPATGPGWEGWAAPPDYTRRPVIYLNALPEGEALSLPEGSRLSFRLYGEGAAVAQDIGSAAADARPEAPVVVAERNGTLTVAGRRFAIEVLPDNPPTIAPGAAPERRADGRLIQSFRATDDNGVTRAQATITLDLPAVKRSYGLTIEPEARDPVVINLPLPARASRTEVTGNLVSDLSQHPWANLPVTVSLSVTDGLDQQGTAAPMAMVLPGRRFFDPLAAALIELRRDLLWSRGNAESDAQLLRAITWQPAEVMDEPTYQRLSDVIAKLEAPELTPETRDEIARLLWDEAVKLEDGGLSDALTRMQRAQERLSEAIRNGASPDEVRRLMDELKQATDDYTQMLADRSQTDDKDQILKKPEGQTITGDQIQEMMDEIERLMNEGKMAEAQELLEQFNRMMANLQVQNTPGGEGGSGRQGGAQQQLSDSLREQQRLADEAMRELQGNPQEQQGRPGQGSGPGQGQPGGQDQAQPGGQGQGQGQLGQGQGQPGQGRGGDGSGADGQGSLSERQQALRRELGRQRMMLPGTGSPEGEAARRELDRAGRAMEDAERALNDGDLGGAMDSQADAIEAMREGLRALGRMNGEGQQQAGERGEAGEGPDGQPPQGSATQGRRGLAALPNPTTDPLGRNSGGNGGQTTEGDPLGAGTRPGAGAQARAAQLLDEIRKRTGQTARTTEERDYLQRLIDQF